MILRFSAVSGGTYNSMYVRMITYVCTYVWKGSQLSTAEYDALPSPAQTTVVIIHKFNVKTKTYQASYY